ncbi:putative urease accessory protein UreF [Escovopsis weberi]|uniref:Putative urease accessory protein UreF n=1 Tax=Escovopsis weberi TaxID=150374 RepID=A0A0M8N1R5_ESCWE|nr:putative urease accessory protein UreF [Escovopsis weberi]
MACNTIPESQEDGIRDEIEDLEQRLREARGRLRAINPSETSRPIAEPMIPSIPSTPSSSTHFLLLLADSALPIGSFAFSSGLESYAAHAAAAASSSSSGGPRAPAPFSAFLPLSLGSVASSALPFVLAAHRRPGALAALDDALDAATVCTVARRASTAQGRALLSIWERSFSPQAQSPSQSQSQSQSPSEAHDCLRSFAALLRRESKAEIPAASAHLAPLFGAISAIHGLSAAQAAYVFLLGHAKALVSAAVRANMFGPYQAQKLLAGGELQALIDAVVRREWDTRVEDAGQSVPVMDLWVGRHETLYSRIFNS